MASNIIMEDGPGGNVPVITDEMSNRFVKWGEKDKFELSLADDSIVLDYIIVRGNGWRFEEYKDWNVRWRLDMAIALQVGWNDMIKEYGNDEKVKSPPVGWYMGVIGGVIADVINKVKISEMEKKVDELKEKNENIEKEKKKVLRSKLKNNKNIKKDGKSKGGNGKRSKKKFKELNLNMGDNESKENDSNDDCDDEREKDREDVIKEYRK